MKDLLRGWRQNEKMWIKNLKFRGKVCPRFA